jgi:hypothetical protein
VLKGNGTQEANAFNPLEKYCFELACRITADAEHRQHQRKNGP